MDIFLQKHRDAILGVVEGFDRVIFKRYLTSMFPECAFGRYLNSRGSQRVRGAHRGDDAVDGGAHRAPSPDLPPH